jgi:transposase
MYTTVLVENKTEVSRMKRIPQGRYTKEFREEAARLVIEDGMSAGAVSNSLSLPKSTVENWARAAKAGRLGEVGKNRKPLTEVEAELARVKRELAITRMERDILKKAAAYLAKESLHGTR